MQEADQLKLELHDIDTEIKNSNGQIEALKQKISQEEKQLEQFTQTSDAAKVTNLTVYIVGC